MRPVDVDDDMERRIARLAQGPKLHHPGRRYVILRGAAVEADVVGSYLGESSFISAHLAWPADQAWCVSTEVDYDSTIVACDHDTATAILIHPDIEALQIPPGAGLDVNADTVNPPG